MRNKILLAQQGDRDAFGQLVSQFRHMALAVAYDRLRDFHLAEDTVQEAFAEAFVHLPKLAEPNAFPAWLKRIVIRQCSRITRRKRQFMVPIDACAELPESGKTPEEIAEQKELRAFVHRHIDELSDSLRIPVLLFYYCGYSLAEISVFMETPASVLKKRLYDARRKLKASLPVSDFISVFQQLHEGGNRMLHIVNGDTVAEKLKQGGVPGDILVWREIYSEGPAFIDPSDPAARSVRADYLEQGMGIPRQEYIGGCEAQERHLRRFKDYDEIVLWFEHDLFDQTMLCYLLHWFKGQKLGRTKLHLLCIGSFPGIEPFRGLGQLSAGQLGALSGTWHSVEQRELELGSAYWEAYASSDPRRLAELLGQDDGTILPFARDAYAFHLSRFPSLQSGLGIVERTTLEHIERGVQGPMELFRQVGDQLHRFGMGDLQFWLIAKRMASGPQPLLHLEGPEADFPTYSNSSQQFAQRRIVLTELGRRVLNGEADWPGAQEAAGWLGGVQLHKGAAAWRWDDRRNKLEKSSPCAPNGGRASP